MSPEQEKAYKVAYERQSKLLDKTMADWMAEIQKTMILLVDHDRMRENLPPVAYQQVFLPKQEHLQFRLLNWKVWCLRYHIPLGFLMSFIFRIYEKKRKLHVDYPRVLILGLPVTMVTGPTCRKRLEAEIAELYPNGENLRPETPQPPIVDIIMPEGSTFDDYTEAYGKMMLSRHAKRAVTLKSERRHPPRPC